MARRKSRSELAFAICAESADDRQSFKAYLARRAWLDTGREYTLTDTSRLIHDAGQGAFNAVFVSVGGLRWFAQVVPDREFAQAESKTDNTAPTAKAIAITEHDQVIIERARAMMVDGPQSVEALAAVLMREGAIKGNASKTATQVRRALLRSRAFCVNSAQDGQLSTWEPWQPTTRSVDDPSGRRTIYTHVLSTTGVSVEIAIPPKPMAEIARILLQGLVPDDGKSPHQMTNGSEPER